MLHHAARQHCSNMLAVVALVALVIGSMPQQCHGTELSNTQLVQYADAFQNVHNVKVPVIVVDNFDAFQQQLAKSTALITISSFPCMLDIHTSTTVHLDVPMSQ
jgi:trimethylamine:corrinoid methyltransferase-like protein